MKTEKVLHLRNMRDCKYLRSCFTRGRAWAEQRRHALHPITLDYRSRQGRRLENDVFALFKGRVLFPTLDKATSGRSFLHFYLFIFSVLWRNLKKGEERKPPPVARSNQLLQYHVFLTLRCFFPWRRLANQSSTAQSIEVDAASIA